MRKLLIAVMLTVLGLTSSLLAQDLDRITLSAGGDATDEVSYVIGETFNFALADGDIILETGSQGSTGNTGGTATSIEQVQTKEEVTISCYPNPATENLYFSVKGLEEIEFTVLVLDINGKLWQKSQIQQDKIMQCQVQQLATGTYFLSLANAQGKVYGVKKFIKK